MAAADESAIVGQNLDQGDGTYGPTMEFDAPAWYGEEETYGTQTDWLTGEGLTSKWGTDPGWGTRPTYTNKVAEALGENKVINQLIDSRSMLSQGGSPSAWDVGVLGLSLLPGVGVPASQGAKRVGGLISQAVRNRLAANRSKSVLDKQLENQSLQSAAALGLVASRIPRVKGQLWNPFVRVGGPTQVQEPDWLADQRYTPMSRGWGA